MTTRTPKDIVLDANLFTAAMHIRQYLCDLSGLIPRLNEDPNPYYGATDDGLTLTEYYGGPSCVGTPLGNWGVTGGGSHNYTWREIATERLGLELLEPEYNTADGTHGPVWRITKDLDGKLLPRATNIAATMYGGGAYTDVLREGNIAVQDMVAELEAAGKKHVWGPDNSDPLAHPTRESWQVYTALRYEYSSMLWVKMKKRLGFFAWDDRVDPEFMLECIYGGPVLDAAIKELGLDPDLAPGFVNPSRSYMLKSETNGLLALIRTDYLRGTGYTVVAVVYPDARDPTQEEIAMLAKLLKPRNAVIASDYTHWNTKC